MVAPPHNSALNIACQRAPARPRLGPTGLTGDAEAGQAAHAVRHVRNDWSWIPCTMEQMKHTASHLARASRIRAAESRTRPAQASRNNPNVQGFVKGAFAAVIGTILGASLLVGKIAIGDWLTALIVIGCLAVLFRFKVSNPLLIGVTALIGLIAFPVLRPAWVFVQ